MLVDCHKLGPGFQRSTGFCEQMDLHDGMATVREALKFSSILRQDREIPRKERGNYDIEDGVISCLVVGQRQRLTIDVELAAKPSLLLFLDEPTFGLDSRSAHSIIQFPKKLARAGQPIVCIIHRHHRF